MIYLAQALPCSHSSLSRFLLLTKSGGRIRPHSRHSALAEQFRHPQHILRGINLHRIMLG